MKAISKFKSLITPRPTSLTSPHLTTTPSLPSSPAPDEKAFAAQATAEFAARVLRERQEFLAKGGKASFDLLTTSSSIPSTTTTNPISTPSNPSDSQQPTPQPTMAPTTHLGIGTGGIDGFTHTTDPHHPAGGAGEGGGDVVVVSDSPTAVDFNVYDAAFDAEIERIKRSTSRKGPPGVRGRGSVGGPGPVYQTRVRERGGGVGGDGTENKGGFARVGGGAVLGQRGLGFAEVVPKAVEKAREEMGTGTAGEGQLREEGPAQ